MEKLKNKEVEEKKLTPLEKISTIQTSGLFGLCVQDFL